MSCTIDCLDSERESGCPTCQAQLDQTAEQAEQDAHHAWSNSGGWVA